MGPAASGRGLWDQASAGRRRPRRPRPRTSSKIKNLPSSDVLVPVLFLVPEVLDLGRLFEQRGRGPSRLEDP